MQRNWRRCRVASTAYVVLLHLVACFFFAGMVRLRVYTSTVPGAVEAMWYVQDDLLNYFPYVEPVSELLAVVHGLAICAIAWSAFHHSAGRLCIGTSVTMCADSTSVRSESSSAQRGRVGQQRSRDGISDSSVGMALTRTSSKLHTRGVGVDLASAAHAHPALAILYGVKHEQDPRWTLVANLPSDSQRHRVLQHEPRRSSSQFSRQVAVARVLRARAESRGHEGPTRSPVQRYRVSTTHIGDEFHH